MGVVTVPIALPSSGTTIEVKFPFPPYAVQIDIMSGALRGLLNGKNALIESPTGTGKTQALLCAAGAFILHQKTVLKNSNAAMMMTLGPNGLINNSCGGIMNSNLGKKIRVVYASRTHSQLAQVVREFKACPYSKVLQMAVLGSREHLCVHSKVNSLPTSQAQNSACNALRAERGCRYFHGVANFLADETMAVQQNQQQQQQSSSSNNEDCGGCNQSNTETDGGENNCDHNNNNQHQTQQVGLHDIEELGNLGRTVGFCPYFYEREVAETADIVFLPYSYIFDPQIVTQLPFSLDGCSLILDEAHNVPSYLAAAKCQSVTPRDTGSAVQDCTRAFAHVENQLRSAADGTSSAPLDAATIHGFKADMDDFAALKLFLVKFEQEISKVFLYEKSISGNQNNNNNNNNNNGSSAVAPAPAPAAVGTVANGNDNGNGGELVKPGIFMLEFLANRCCNLNSQSWALMSDVITRAIARLNESGTSVVGLTKIFDFFTNIFRTPQDDLTSKTSAYRFVAFPYNPEGNNHNNNNYHNNNNNNAANNANRNCLGFWCLDCSVGMTEVSERVSSMILASGTLSPMPHFAAELGVPFPITVQGGHVIQENQLLSLVLRRGPTGVDLNSSYTNRNNIGYSQQLGLSLVSIAQTVPDGMIVFFPSYAAMNSALDAWKNKPVMVTNSNNNNNNNTNNNNNNQNASHQTIWGMLSEVKPVHVEPRDTSECNTVVKEYRKAIDSKPPGAGKGAILLAVCRGKVSEGLDFADRHGRAVIVTGLPFAHHGDLFVRLKKAHITAVAEFRPRVDGKLFTGDDWYKNEAMRAVNQALGRVIRHKDDYGAVILADDRFGSHVRALSGWVRKANVVCAEFRDAYQRLNNFFTGWTAKESAKKEQAAVERRRKILEEKHRLLGMLGKNNDENGDDMNATMMLMLGNNNTNDGMNNIDGDADEQELAALTMLAARAAENAALALRAKHHQQQQNQHQNNNHNNSVLTNLIGTHQHQSSNNTNNFANMMMMNNNNSSSSKNNNNNNNGEIPAPVALKAKSIFQKATLVKKHESNLLQQQHHQEPQMPMHLPSTTLQQDAASPAGNSSRQQTVVTRTGNAAVDFINKVKSLFSPEQYQEYRNRLKILLDHVKLNLPNVKQSQQSQQPSEELSSSMNSNRSQVESDFRNKFRENVASIQEIFGLASDVNEREQLAVDFGCFIPEVMRPMYSEIVRRRQR